MRRTSLVVTGPATEPLTLGEVKAWARIDGTDEDALLQSLITAARESAEQFLRRSLISQTVRLTLDLDCSGLNNLLGEGVYDLPESALHGSLPEVIELPRGPILSITSVKTYDLSNTESTFDPSNYSLSGSRLVLAYGASWPSSLRPTGAVDINYVAGYGATSSSVPQAIRSAMQMHIQAMYDGRTVCEMPEPCQRLLRAYRIMDGLAYG